MRFCIHAHPTDLVALGEGGGHARLAGLGFQELTIELCDDGFERIPSHAAASPRGSSAGELWFRPSGDYQALRPKVAQDAPPEELDLFAKHADQCREHGLSARALLRPLTSAAHAQNEPRFAVVDALGRRHASRLCPSHPAVFDYARWLVADVAEQTGLETLELAGLGFPGPEFGPTKLRTADRVDPAVAFLLSVCFCAECAASMERTGIGSASLRKKVVRLIHERLSTRDVLAPRPSLSIEEHFRTLETELGHAGMFAIWSHRLGTYLRLLKAFRSEIAGRTRLAVHVHFHSLFAGDGLGAPLPALHGHADEWIVANFEETPQALAQAWRSESLRGRPVRAGITPHPPWYRSTDDVYLARTAVEEAGGAGLVVRSLGLLPWPTLERVAAILRDASGVRKGVKPRPPARR
ncbi:MAG: hypothetical protein AB7I19_02615 [Planctomycetota bacterium]